VSEAPIHDVPRRESCDARPWFQVGPLAPPNHPPTPWPERLSAAIALAWDGTGLLVRAELEAPLWREADAADRLWQACSLELILAPGLQANDRCQWIVAPGMDPRYPAPRLHLHDHRTSPELRCLPADAAIRDRTAGATCRLELRLPWSALAIVPAPGREVRFQAMANGWDETPKNQPHLVWFPRLGAAGDVRPMHRLRLAEEQTPSQRAALRRSGGASPVWRITATPAEAGSTVAVRCDGETMAVGVLDADGSCVLPDRRRADGIVELLLDGHPDDAWPLRLPAGPEPARRATALPRLALDGAAPVISPPDPGRWRIRRRRLDGDWQESATVAGPWQDNCFAHGVPWEYALHREDGDPASAHLAVGIGLPPVDRRGTALLVVDSAIAGPLAPEIARLHDDLVGDGWTVRRLDTDRAGSPESVRRAIATAVREVEGPVSAILLGRIPVPYSGRISPDGHPDHAGVWPCDAVYAALEAGWSDLRTTAADDPRQANAPGDGRYDQDTIPDPLRLAVGRIDMRDLPAFAVDEITLLRRYLDRNHAWRHGRLPAAERALVQDGFAYHPEGFAGSGWANGHALFGPGRTQVGDWPWLGEERCRLFYACGSGQHRAMGGFGSTADLAEHGLDAVFTLLFGSYFGDWDRPDNLMRAALAAGALTCGWAGRPHWFLHPMALGATIGDALLRTQRNIGADYHPAGTGVRGVHIALMGDPTLRLHPLPPPGPVTALRRGCSVDLRWQAAPTAGAYHIYRDDGGGFRRLTTSPVTESAWTDDAAPDNAIHQVRTLAEQRVWCGSYANLSQGVTATIVTSDPHRSQP
jgi:hypothetical protein